MSEIESGKYFAKLSSSTHYPEYLTKVCEAQAVDKIKIETADKTIDIMLSLIEGYKGLPTSQNGTLQKWAEVLIVSAYLYHIFYDEKHAYTSLMNAREKTEKIADECKLPANEQEFLFEGVESANGFYGPQKLRCQCDTPSEMLTLAIWINKNLHSWC